MSLQLWKNKKNEFLSFAFNQDSSCFAAGTQTGYRVYRTFPFREVARREEFPDVEDDGSCTVQGRPGGLGIVEMLHMCSVLAVVGGGMDPRWPNNKVVLWDDRDERSIAELAFKQPVKAVRLRRDVILIALETRIYLYFLRELEPMDHLETAPNPHGVCAMTSDPYRLVVACPYTKKGRVAIYFYKTAHAQNNPNAAPAAGPSQAQGVLTTTKEQTVIIAAHESEVACIALNKTGSTVASASVKGTLVRVYDARNGSQLFELRRGLDKAHIYSLAFDPLTRWMAATSDKGTVHLWTLAAPPEKQAQQLQRQAAHTAEASNPNRKRVYKPNQEGDAPVNAQGPPSPSKSLGPSERDGTSQQILAPSPPPTGLGTPPGDILALASSLDSSQQGGKNVKSKLSFLGAVLPSYFSSSWAFATARVKALRNVCAFVPSRDNQLAVITADGLLETFIFDPVRGGDMKKDMTETLKDGQVGTAGVNTGETGGNGAGSGTVTVRSKVLAQSPPADPSFVGTPPQDIQ